MVEPDERVEQVYLVSPDGVVQPTPTVVSPPSAVDWDRLEVLERNDDEGRLEIVGDDAFYEMLGLRAEDEQAKRIRQSEAVAGDTNSNADNGKAPAGEDNTGAAIPVDDAIPGERVMAYDPNNPCMALGTIYPSMPEFRIAMRQFAINKEFELHVAKTDRVRYIGNCKVDGCPWHIVGHRQPDLKTVKVWH